MEEKLSREYILNLKRIMDLKNIVTNKKLNTIEGAISLQKINIKTFEEYKLKTADLLFPLIWFF